MRVGRALGAGGIRRDVVACAVAVGREAPVSTQDSAGTIESPAQADKDQHPGQRLGPFLCWAVVFADIGTSVYYTPGILFGPDPTSGVGTHAALFVLMTMAVFVLLSLKYAEVTIRYPEGGGVVTVGTRALHPFVGLVGGMFILVDYFLTAALSAVSGIGYLAFVAPFLNSNLIAGVVAMGALAVLGILNWIGISESAKVSATFATLAFISQIAIVVGVLLHLGLGDALATIPRMVAGPHLAPVAVLTGYAGAFLAFSGLESISQLSPVMREPRTRVARVAMGAVVGTIGLTSPLLTLWSTTLLSPRTIYQNTASNNILSLLADAVTGRWLGIEVALSGSILLIFACNTAIIGTYHVFLAISRMRFFPEFVARRNKLRGTPHFAIMLAVGIPVLILIPASLSPNTQTILGDLYAFGLLGAFSVTCVGLDVVRWREQRLRGPDGEERGSPVSLATRVLFFVGILTTALVVLAWGTNLVHKPLATLFGGSVSVIGLLVAATNYMLLNRRGIPVIFPSEVRTVVRDAILVVLPATGDAGMALARAAGAVAGGSPVVFLYRGENTPNVQGRRPELFEVVDPYSNDRAAQLAFGQAERVSKGLKLDRRYVYIPAGADRDADAITTIWQTIQPRETLALANDAAVLHGIAPDRVRRPVGAGQPIVHYLKHWPARR
ncbi:MAG: hypothetical protein NVSMB65_09670 [Chloroflexota bacterium]